jgi:hypothetical protein
MRQPLEALTHEEIERQFFKANTSKVDSFEQWLEEQLIAERAERIKLWEKYLLAISVVLACNSLSQSDGVIRGPIADGPELTMLNSTLSSFKETVL